MNWGPGLAAAMLLAGCLGGTGGPPSSRSSTTSLSAGVPFDGVAALEFVKGLALQSDGSPRLRMPGTPGQNEGAAYLWSQMDVPDWSRHWQNFTGRDYLALDRSQVAGYGPGSRFCPAADEQVLPSWPFHNLYAIHPGLAQGGPLLLIGAHWDSQMHSQQDANVTRQGWPDPGANDGASGVGLLLQLMRHVSAAPPLPFDVGVFLIDGEDGFFDCYPIAGALYFTQHPPVAVGRFILLDMVGDPVARFAHESRSASSDPALLNLVWSHGRAAGGADLFTNNSVSIDDDHLAFIQAGIPSIDLIDADSQRPNLFPLQWDTSGDTVDRLSPRTLGIVGQAILDALRYPAMAPPWPMR